jgi:Zn-dependent protease with chaperone function
VGALEVDYFDGRSSRAHPALLQLSQRRVQILNRSDSAPLASFDLKDVRWPERTRYGARIAQLPEGASVQSRDAVVWDGWVAQKVAQGEVGTAGGMGNSWVVRAQQSWRGVALALVLLVVFVGGTYRWGLPVFAQAVTAAVPHDLDELLGRNALAQIDSSMMKPTQLPAATQERIRQRFAKGVQQTYGADAPSYQLQFRQSTIGPNAFALPGGTMVMTDELVELVNDDEVLMGVLGHELGHVTARHGIRQLVQATTLQVALGVAFGDYGNLITLAPLLLGSMAYSRDHEREADAESVRFMRAAGVSPLVMVKFFEAVRAQQRAKEKSSDAPKTAKTQKTPLGISIISSHPADEERMRLFREAAK